jgi:hypothetical protein
MDATARRCRAARRPSTASECGVGRARSKALTHAQLREADVDGPAREHLRAALAVALPDGHVLLGARQSPRSRITARQAHGALLAREAVRDRRDDRVHGRARRVLRAVRRLRPTLLTWADASAGHRWDTPQHVLVDDEDVSEHIWKGAPRPACVRLVRGASCYPRRQGLQQPARGRLQRAQ